MTSQLERVSVIIPHYNDIARLANCLDCLDRQSYPRELTEVIVCDNGSTLAPGALEAAVRGRARVVHETALKGAYAARNRAVAEAGGDVLAFTNSDCVPGPGWLAAGVAALRPRTIVGGSMQVLVADEAAMTAAEAFERVFAFRNDLYTRRKGFSVTANMFVAREAFAEVGPFRRDVSEDAEWCLRAGRSGYAMVYAADAVVGHPARHTWDELRGKWARLVRESYALHRDSGRGIASWIARAWLMPLSALAHAPRVLRERSLAPALRLKALAMLVRLRLWRFYFAHKVMLS